MEEMETIKNGMEMVNCTLDEKNLHNISLIAANQFDKLKKTDDEERELLLHSVDELASKLLRLRERILRMR